MRLTFVVGFSFSGYEQYAEDIRKEYMHIPYADYCTKRAKVRFKYYIRGTIFVYYSGPSTVRPLYWTAAPHYVATICMHYLPSALLKLPLSCGRPPYVAKPILQNGWPPGRGITVNHSGPHYCQETHSPSTPLRQGFPLLFLINIHGMAHKPKIQYSHIPTIYICLSSY